MKKRTTRRDRGRPSDSKFSTEWRLRISRHSLQRRFLTRSTRRQSGRARHPPSLRLGPGLLNPSGTAWTMPEPRSQRGTAARRSPSELLNVGEGIPDLKVAARLSAKFVPPDEVSRCQKALAPYCLPFSFCRP